MESKEALLGRVKKWQAGDPDESCRAELQALVDGGKLAELAERMAGPLAFGTAGLRGVLGAGESLMNLAVILRTSLGLGRYLLEQRPRAQERGVVIGYDGRRKSREFAHASAEVLVGLGIRVFLFDGEVPTPLLAYGVRHLQTAAGIMVTASHNPPEYNGFKVYWDNGAQIIPPHDRGIAEAIAKVGPANEVPRAGKAAADGLLQAVPADVEAAYLAGVSALLRPQKPASLPLVYTPLHGVGNRVAQLVMAGAAFGEFYAVPQQAEPDGEFPTVAFPNPEEPGALDLAYELAAEKDAKVILANDPDADRLAAATAHGDGFYQLTGNEIGLLLADYLLATRPDGGAKRLVMNTIVSSPGLSAIAKHYGVLHGEVLTGFKWIATSAMAKAESQGARFVFGYEEALGYTVGELVRDKDGIGAMVVFAEMLRAGQERGQGLLDLLADLAARVGLFASSQVSTTYKGTDGARTIAGLMDRLRSNPPAEVADQKVVVFRDILVGKGKGPEGEFDVDLPQSNVLSFELANGDRVIVRPSGTEPKIKCYFDVSCPPGPGDYVESKAVAMAALADLEQAFAPLLQPES